MLLCALRENFHVERVGSEASKGHWDGTSVRDPILELVLLLHWKNLQ